jgi:branched-subunit amino acid aminotransferase/4-amino-4-deoxychorismate lyase
MSSLSSDCLPPPLLDGQVVDERTAADRFAKDKGLTFTTFLCRHGQVALWSLHRKRLCVQAEWMGIQMKPGDWESALQTSLDALGGVAAGRLALFPNGDFLLSFRPLRSYSVLRAAWIEWEPGPGALPGWVKHGRRSHWQTAQAEKGCDELLWHDSLGRVLEGMTCNVFHSDGIGLQTPPLDGRILAGVGRATVVTGAKRLGTTVEERPLQWTESGCWLLSSSLKGLVPLQSLESEGTARPSAEIQTLMESLQQWQWESDFEEEAGELFPAQPGFG